jgi:diguanylate cyclase (GGDEF)-like protein
MRFWASSIIMALSMQSLATRMRMVAADELFSLGLLARVGELALATVYPAKYGQLLAEIATGKAGVDLVELERQSLAMSHADLGAAMLSDWGIPPVFTGPVRYFEHPLEAPFAANGREAIIMQCLALARCVADICLGTPDEQQVLMGKALRLAAHMGCAREPFISDCDETVRQWYEWSKLLQLDHVELPSFEVLSGIEPGRVETGRASPARAAGEEAEAQAAIFDLRAVLIESDANMRERLSKALKDIEVEVFSCSGFDGVMERILDVQPHMLVLESGETLQAARLIRTLRASRLGRGMYILALLPSDDEKHIAAAIEAGADELFIKSFGTRVLLARLNAAMRTIQLQQELEHEREELRHFAAELAISNRSLQEAALTDALTSLPNRRYALERMQQEWAAAHRSARSLACMVIDLDGFKQINDIYGHDVGDIALRLASEALRRVLRGQDVICRTGGDEFLVICPETSLEEVLACGERLRKEIDRLTVNNEDEVLRLSISVGVAVRDESMSSASDLVKKADRAVFVAKRHGRNQVVQASGSEEDAPEPE